MDRQTKIKRQRLKRQSNQHFHVKHLLGSWTGEKSRCKWRFRDYWKIRLWSLYGDVIRLVFSWCGNDTLISSPLELQLEILVFRVVVLKLWVVAVREHIFPMVLGTEIPLSSQVTVRK